MSSGHLVKVAQSSPGKVPCPVLQRKAKNPWGHLLAQCGGKKNPSSLQLQGTRGHLHAA